MTSETSPLLAPQLFPSTNPPLLEPTHIDTSPDTKRSSELSPPIESGEENFPPKPNFSFTIPILFLGNFVSQFEGSFIIGTSGIIASEFNHLADAQWLLTTFLLAASASQPLYGKLSDIYGRKNTLLVSYSLFIIGCAMCGFGTSLGQVLIGRIIGGVGASGMSVLVVIVISDLVPKRQIGVWSSYANISGTTGRSLGAPIGGLLADRVGWRWAFLAQCPVMVVALLLVLWKLQLPSQTSSFQDESSSNSARAKFARIDFPGAIMLASAILCLLLVLDLSGKTGNLTLILILIGFTLALGVSFVVVEKRWAKEPIFPISLLTNRDVVIAYVPCALQTSAQLCLNYTIPLYFQVSAGSSTSAAGARILPAVCGNAIASLISGQIMKRTGKYKLLTLTGLALASTAYLLVILRWHGHTNLAELSYIFFGGVGAGVIGSTSFIQLNAALGPSQIAIAGSGLYVSSSIGMTAGVSIVNAVLQATLRPGLEKNLNGVDGKDEIIEKAISNLEYVRSLKPSPIKSAVVRSYVQSCTYMHAVPLVASIAALIFSLFMREYTL